MSKSATVTSNSRKLLVSTKDGLYRLSVPEDAKFTFGPAVPYIGKKDYNFNSDNKGYALRVYRGTKENLLAVFSGVSWFRDLSLVVEKEVVSKSGSAVWSEDESGHDKRSSEKVSREFKEEKS